MGNDSLQDETPDSLEELVRAKIAALANKWQWQLVSTEELLACVRRACPAFAQLTDKELRYIVWGEYNGRLYTACCAHPSEAQDQSAVRTPSRLKDSSTLRGRQARAFKEVGIYLSICARARGYTAEQVDRAVSAALLEIYANLHLCKEPRAFLYVCLGYLRTQLRRIRREWFVESLEALPPEVEGQLKPAWGPNVPDPEQHALCALLWRQFLERIETFCREQAPRAARQISAVLLKYLGEMTDEQIALELGTTVANVMSLRAKGLQRLCGDGDLLALYVELCQVTVSPSGTRPAEVKAITTRLLRPLPTKGRSKDKGPTREQGK
jgi:DNA-directed RNA polymerase specialized sigma24 family protein